MTANPTIPSAPHLEAFHRRKLIVDGFKTWEGTLTEYAASHKVAPSTVLRLIQTAAKGAENLLDKRMNNRRPVALSDQVAAWCFAYWADHPKAHLKDIWREVSAMAEKANLRPFSYKQVRLLFDRTPKELRIIVADGAREGFEKAGLVARRVRNFSNQEWQMDATELDLWVQDMATGLWFKPWMTCAIDCFSRVIMAAILHRHEPTTADALRTLRAAILPKGENDQPFFGLPMAISLDNHSTYKSADFLDALRRLNINKIDIPNACPSGNGVVERFFNTFKYGALARFAGYAGQHNGLAKAKRGAVPWPLVPKLIRKFMVEYHYREHAGIQTTPWEKWHENLEDTHGLTVSPSELDDAIKLRRVFTVKRDGIEVVPGRHYSGTCLNGLVDEPIQILISPDERDEKIPAYYQHKYIGDLGCLEEDSALANDIRRERLNSSIDIQRVFNGLRGLLPQEEVNTVEVHQVPPLGPVMEPITSKEPVAQKVEPLGAIPEIKADTE